MPFLPVQTFNLCLHLCLFLNILWPTLPPLLKQEKLSPSAPWFWDAFCSNSRDLWAAERKWRKSRLNTDLLVPVQILVWCDCCKDTSFKTLFCTYSQVVERVPIVCQNFWLFFFVKKDTKNSLLLLNLILICSAWSSYKVCICIGIPNHITLSSIMFGKTVTVNFFNNLKHS